MYSGLWALAVFLSAGKLGSFARHLQKSPRETTEGDGGRAGSTAGRCDSCTTGSRSLHHRSRLLVMELLVCLGMELVWQISREPSQLKWIQRKEKLKWDKELKWDPNEYFYICLEQQFKESTLLDSNHNSWLQDYHIDPKLKRCIFLWNTNS